MRRTQGLRRVNDRKSLLKKRWSYFIRKVYETDPLTCPKYQWEMRFDTLLTTLRGLEGRIISFIDQPDVIRKILRHLGLWERFPRTAEQGLSKSKRDNV